MSLVSVHFRFGGQIQLLIVIVICNDFRSVDFDIGVPLPKSHIHNVFQRVNIISVDNGQTERKRVSTSSPFGFCAVSGSGTYST